MARLALYFRVLASLVVVLSVVAFVESAAVKKSKELGERALQMPNLVRYGSQRDQASEQLRRLSQQLRREASQSGSAEKRAFKNCYFNPIQCMQGGAVAYGE